MFSSTNDWGRPTRVSVARILFSQPNGKGLPQNTTSRGLLLWVELFSFDYSNVTPAVLFGSWHSFAIVFTFSTFYLTFQFNENNGETRKRHIIHHPTFSTTNASIAPNILHFAASALWWTKYIISSWDSLTSTTLNPFSNGFNFK